ncbi:MAG TPA: DUF5615 family PIN-like protein [Dehalococcoidia bacterium]|nr:DUF5615 family PIN-like protein [Dehalococcoidia bacterium]
MHFLVDETLPPALAPMLFSEGHDATMVIETALRHAADQAIAELAIEQDRIVIARDVRFPVRTARSIPGLVPLRLPPNHHAGDIMDLMTNLIRSPWRDELMGRITVVRQGQTRSRRIQDV